MYANELRLDDIRMIGVGEGETARAILARGDLLVVEGNGSLDQIGRVALWDGVIAPCVHQNHLIKVRFSPVELGGFALSWLLSPAGRAAIQRVANSTSGLYTLSISKVERLPVPVPPLAEQRRITLELDRVTTIAAALMTQIAVNTDRCARARQSILKWAFDGRLVDQDPTDEPASLLLERIRAEYESSNGSKPNARGRPRMKATTV